LVAALACRRAVKALSVELDRLRNATEAIRKAALTVASKAARSYTAVLSVVALRSRRVLLLARPAGRVSTVFYRMCMTVGRASIERGEALLGSVLHVIASPGRLLWLCLVAALAVAWGLLAHGLSLLRRVLRLCGRKAKQLLFALTSRAA